MKPKGEASSIDMQRFVLCTFDLQALGAELSDHNLDHNIALKKNHVHTNLLGTKVVMQA